MAKNTPNYRFIKPDYSDAADVKDLNDNMELLDEKLQIVDTQATANRASIVQINGRLQEDEASLVRLRNDLETGLTETKNYAYKQAAEAKAACTETQQSNTQLGNRVAAAENKVETLRQDVNTLSTQSKTANQNALKALQEIINTANDVGALKAALAKNTDRVDMLELLTDGKIDGAYVENGYLYMTASDVVVVGPLGPFSGTGGGGGASGDANVTLNVSNTSGWLSTTVTTEDKTVPVSFSWSSIENEMSTGTGSLQILVNDVVKRTMDIPQGENVIDVKPFLGVGANKVTLRISDVYGNTRSLTCRIQVISLYITSEFDDSLQYEGTILFSYTPVGNVEKTIQFYVDDQKVGQTSTSVSGSQQSFIIPEQTYGTHSLKVYFTAEVNAEIVKSNELFYELMCVNATSDLPLIASSFAETEVQQWSSVRIPYYVYSPNSLTSEIQILVNGSVVSTQTVDRTKQEYVWRAAEAGETTIAIVVIGDDIISKTINLNVTEMDLGVHAETEALALHLSTYGRSNNEETRGEWKDGTVECELTGFDYVSNGWVLDADGNTCLRVSGDARVSIPFKPFAEDFRSTGKTIELEFATSNVMDYDAVVMSCMNGGRGFQLTAQEASFDSESSHLKTQYKENEHVRITFVIEKRTSKSRLIICYINGVASRALRYSDTDDFSQVVPQNIVIGSNDCAVDLYGIRVYDNDLTRRQVTANWTADTQNVDDLVDRYTRNDIYDEYGNVVISKLPKDLPYMILSGSILPQYKGDKRTVSGSYVDQTAPALSFTFDNVQIDVQGTSSQFYARKNYKLKYKGGFVRSDGTTVAKYQLEENTIPVSTMCMKADVASSEGANNVELARLYDIACPYKTPAQVKDSKVRQGITGHPIVIFHDNGEATSFLGKYNMNVDKSCEDYFGFVTGDESWEIKNNTGNRVIWKSDDYASMGVDKDGNPIPAWQNDFEARFPDTDPAYTDATQLRELASWLKSTDRSAATGAALPSPVTYQVASVETVEVTDQETGAISYIATNVTKDVTYTHDTAEYRLAKFKNEINNYIEFQSAMYYYVFTEIFLMVDSRAKNAFPSFLGTDLT